MYFMYLIMQMGPRVQVSSLLMPKKHIPLTRSWSFIFLYYKLNVNCPLEYIQYAGVEYLASPAYAVQHRSS